MSAQDYWDKKHTKQYAQEDWINNPSLFAEWSKQYFPHSGNLLDLGTGQGQDACFFAKHDFNVTAADFSAAALKLAKQKSPDDITFQQLDFSQSLPFTDSSFDVVYSHLALHYFDTPTTQALFTEIHRVLKDGGVLAALLNSTKDPDLVIGEKLEDNFISLNDITKHYFSPTTVKDFAKDFKIIIADDQGLTYKDEVMGVRNLVRLICKK